MFPDGIGRLRQQITQRGTTTIESSTYTYVNGQRQAAATVRRNKAGQTSTFDWSYGYNGRSEVTSGVKKIGTSVVPGYHFGYEFDAIGNRTKATVNTNESILTPNGLNQITGRTVPGVAEVRGSVTTAATLTSVAAKLLPDGQWNAGTTLAGQFYTALPVENTNGPRIGKVRVEATSESVANEYKQTEERTYEFY